MNRKFLVKKALSILVPMREPRKLGMVFFFIVVSSASTVRGSGLYVGTAEANITPDLPVALAGQFHLRIAHTVRTPLVANVIVLESRDGERSLEQTVFVACDLVGIPRVLTEMVRKQVQQQIPELDVKKIVLSATHTHTAPVMEKGTSFEYNITKEGVSQPDKYQQLFAQRVTAAIVKAWKARKPASITWGLTYANVGRNRRAVYEYGPERTHDNRTSIYLDGTAKMYGKTDIPEFQSIEGYEDHAVNTLFFWNKAGKLIATSIELACPAQEVEGDTVVDADYWHAVRVSLKKRFGSELLVMGWCGAAGDQSPHLMYGKRADDRMRTLKKLSRIDAISQRIVRAVEESYETVKNDRHTSATLFHQVETLSLPMRIVTEGEYEDSKKVVNDVATQIAADSKAADKILAKMTWYDAVVKRYEMQKTNPNPTYDTEIHVIRLGDVVICTNQFELFTDYGIRMQARSKALQTIIIQLAGPGTYLPTSKAVAGGSYSAIVQSNLVGPEGGQILVDRTVKLIDGLWEDVK